MSSSDLIVAYNHTLRGGSAEWDHAYVSERSRHIIVLDNGARIAKSHSNI